MNKKKYISPVLEIIETTASCPMLAGSPAAKGFLDSTPITDGGSSTNDPNAGLSGDAKSYKGWDSWDESGEY